MLMWSARLERTASFLVGVTGEVAVQPLAAQPLQCRVPPLLLCPRCPALGCGTCSPFPCSHQVCEPLGGRDPGSTVHSPRPGQPSVGEDVRPHRPVAVSKPRSHEVRRRKAAEFWYCCCSWCCESGRRAAHPLTRLFHDTRVASYPFSPGEPRGTDAWDAAGGRTRGWGRGDGRGDRVSTGSQPECSRG